MRLREEEFVGENRNCVSVATIDRLWDSVLSAEGERVTEDVLLPKLLTVACDPERVQDPLGVADLVSDLVPPETEVLELAAREGDPDGERLSDGDSTTPSG